MHAELVESLRLGLTVFVRGDAALREARRLVARKRLLRRLEAEAAEVNIRALHDTTKEAQTVLAAESTAAFFFGWCGTCAASTPTSPHSPTRSSNARPQARIAVTARRHLPQRDSSPMRPR